MHSKPGAVAGAALSLMLLAACQPVPTGSPSVTVSPVATGPAPVCTATPGATPTPCTAEQQAAQQAEQQKQDALYREAERVYRAFVIEDARLVREGSVVDPATLALIGGPFVPVYTEARAKQHSSGLTATGEVSVAFVKPAAGSSYQGSDVALESCVDASKLSVSQAGKVLGPGPIARGYTYFKRTDGVLKIWWQTSKKVEACGG